MELVIESPSVQEISDYEIERGKPMPSKNHSVLQGNLDFELKSRYRKHFTFLPEVNVQMPQKPDCVPDISIYPKLEIDFLHDEISMEELPITAIEIISPKQSIDSIMDKFERYFLAGVQSCWLVVPSLKAIHVYSQIGKYQFFSSEMTLLDPVTNIELPLNEVFNL